MTQSAPKEITPPGVTLLDPDDHSSRRKNILDGVHDAFGKSFPVSFGGVTMHVDNLGYEGDAEPDYKAQKEALMNNKYLSLKLRGDVHLTDDKTGELLDKQRLSLMRVPLLTERGTFIHNGSEYTTIMQSRLLPGVYTRRQGNGQLESHFVPKPGTGVSVRVGFEPDTAQYRLKIKAANLHLYSLFKDLGVPDEQLQTEWGPEVFDQNAAKYDARVFEKAYKGLVHPREQKPDATREEKAVAIRAALDKTQIHERVAKKNLPNMFDLTKSAEWRGRFAGVEAMEKQAHVFAPDLSYAEIEDAYGHWTKQASFNPDLHADDMKEEFNSVVGKAGPRLASMKEWPSKWLTPGAPLGWLSWYRDYCDGKRDAEEDTKHIARWSAFKARHGAEYVRNPTARRAFALRNWAVDPLQLLPESKREQAQADMDDYKAKARDNWLQEKSADMHVGDLATLAVFLNKEHNAGIDPAAPASHIEMQIVDFLKGTGLNGSVARETHDVYALPPPVVAPNIATNIMTPAVDPMMQAKMAAEGRRSRLERLRLMRGTCVDCGKAIGDEVDTRIACPACDPEGHGKRADFVDLVKEAGQLDDLLAAKQHSDRQQYSAKNSIAARMMHAAPEEFFVDSDDGRYTGVTHAPTGFRMHLPAALVPAAVRLRGNSAVIVSGDVAAGAPGRYSNADGDGVPQFAGADMDPAHAKVVSLQEARNFSTKRAGVQYLNTFVPTSALDSVRTHGLLSGNELAKAENRALLEMARNASNDDSADAWLERKAQREKDTPWIKSYQGPSVFFGDPDPGKIHDKHPLKRFDAAPVRINLTALLQKYPETVVHGSELIPFAENYDTLSKKDQDKHVRGRHHDLTSDEVTQLLEAAKDPAQFWKHYNDPEGARYAGNVPHAQVITPHGKIDPEFLEFADIAKAASADVCGSCGHEFNADAVFEIAMGSVACPSCGAPVHNESKQARAAIDWDAVEAAREQARKDTEEPKSGAQAEAGNYAKGRFWWNGLELVIENAKGKYRRDKKHDPPRWKVLMKSDYGYVKGTVSGADGNNIDVFLGPDLDSPIVYIIDQRKESGVFDEHKAMLGYESEAAARKAYLDCYEEGWTGLKACTPLTVPQFKAWVFGDTTHKEMADHKEIPMS